MTKTSNMSTFYTLRSFLLMYILELLHHFRGDQLADITRCSELQYLDVVLAVEIAEPIKLSYEYFTYKSERENK